MWRRTSHTHVETVVARAQTVGWSSTGSTHTPKISRASPSPAQVEASTKVFGLERCITLFNPDTAELKSLQAALARARAQMVLPHLANKWRIAKTPEQSDVWRRLEKWPNNSRGGGQVRAGTPGESAEVGGSQGRCCFVPCETRHRGPTTDIARRYGCGGESVASRRAGIAGEGRSPREPRCRRPTNTDSVVLNPSNVMAILIEKANMDLGFAPR